MLRCIALSAVILLAAYNPIPAERSQQQEHTQAHTSSAQPNAPPLVPKVGQNEGNCAEKKANGEAKAKHYLKDAFAPAYLSNWILAGLGVVGGVIALFTLHAIKRQADFQATALRQWVELGESTSTAEDCTDAFGETSELAWISLSYEIVNPTTFPLIVKGISWKVSTRKGAGGLPVWQRYEDRGKEFILPPVRYGKEGSYPCFIRFEIQGAQEVELYLSRNYLIQVVGCVEFEEVSGEIREQRFPHFAICGPHTLTRSGMLANDRKANQTYDSHD